MRKTDHPTDAAYDALSVARVLRELLWQSHDLSVISPCDLAAVMDVVVEKGTTAIDRIEMALRQRDG